MQKVEDWLSTIPSSQTRKNYLNGIRKFENEFYKKPIESLLDLSDEELGHVVERVFSWLKQSHPQNTARNQTNTLIQYLKHHGKNPRYKRSLGIFHTVISTKDHLLTTEEVQKLARFADLKEQFDGNQRGYFKLRADIESSLILETNWLAFWKECAFLDKPLENLELFSDSDLLTLNQVLVESLKDFIDAHEEKNEICLRLNDFHKKTFANLRLRFPDELSHGDGFTDYLEDRDSREHKEDYRKTGSHCIHCNSEKVTSHGKEWKCSDCGKRFRKR